MVRPLAHQAPGPGAAATPEPRRAESRPDTVAAVDLGSNSFHMIVARLSGGELSVVDRLRERVALGAGMDAERRLALEVRERALACLDRFGQRLAGFAPGSVRAVGTNALREARDARSFLREAALKLGHPIEIIPGTEEARLIYLGVAHDLSDDLGRRLVVDVGGGSTECIVGERFETLRTDSLRMGCISYTERFFPSGVIDERAMERARLAARIELETIERRYARLGWAQAIGASGTINACASILRENGWSERGITPKGLKKLRKALVAAGDVRRLSLAGLAADRVAVIPGGVAVLSGVFDSLHIERMDPSDGALREGLLYDLVGRIRHEDVRDRTIRAFSERYDVDPAQAQRVEETALWLLGEVAGGWGLALERGRQLLGWAARLHEIGLSIRHSRYQKHGAYIVGNAELPGFSGEDQETLAALIGGHRRKLDTAPFAALPSDVLPLCVLLRLSVCLHRSRSTEPLPSMAVATGRQVLVLSFPEDWLDVHPLTRADLELEAECLRAAGYQLAFA
jgi:exopolyphosphatase/guanosine-5'-triphosphate,3'-diphosphate pyrophosphatase